MVGLTVGAVDGLRVGPLELGLSVGCELGASVGKAVGDSVGDLQT